MSLLRYNLNRKIAGSNGVVLNDPKTWLDAALAANKWAGTDGLDIVGALNKKADIARSPKDFRDLMGICNELAVPPTVGLDVDSSSDTW